MRIVVIIVLIIYPVLTFAQNKDVLTNQIKKKKFAFGIGIPLSLNSLKSLYQISFTNMDSKFIIEDNLYTRGFYNLSINSEINISEKIVFCNYIRIDPTGIKNRSIINGFNLYPSVNYIYKKSMIGLGISYIVGQYRIYYTGSNRIVEQERLSEVFPILNYKYSLINNSFGKVCLFTYLGYSNFFRFNTSGDIKINSNKDIVILLNNFGNNAYIENFFTNLIGISYEVTF